MLHLYFKKGSLFPVFVSGGGSTLTCSGISWDISQRFGKNISSQMGIIWYWTFQEAIQHTGTHFDDPVSYFMTTAKPNGIFTYIITDHKQHIPGGSSFPTTWDIAVHVRYSVNHLHLFAWTPAWQFRRHYRRRLVPVVPFIGCNCHTLKGLQYTCINQW